MRGSRVLDAVDGVQDGVERRVHPHRDVRAVHIVVDRRRNAHDRKAHLVQLKRAGQRAVAADDHQPLGAQAVERAQRLAAPLLGLELGAAGSAQERPALAHNPAIGGR